MRKYLLARIGLYASLVLFLTASEPKAEPVTDSPQVLCGTAIGWRFRSEVDHPSFNDKYKHCALSCVITLYCGPIESLGTGILKEVLDSLGLGDPDLEDLRADLHGIRIALRLPNSGNRDPCYRACSAEFPGR